MSPAKDGRLSTVSKVRFWHDLSRTLRWSLWKKLWCRQALPSSTERAHLWPPKTWATPPLFAEDNNIYRSNGDFVFCGVRQRKHQRQRLLQLFFAFHHSGVTLHSKSTLKIPGNNMRIDSLQSCAFSNLFLICTANSYNLAKLSTEASIGISPLKSIILCTQLNITSRLLTFHRIISQSYCHSSLSAFLTQDCRRTAKNSLPVAKGMASLVACNGTLSLRLRKGPTRHRPIRTYAEFHFLVFDMPLPFP